MEFNRYLFVSITKENIEQKESLHFVILTKNEEQSIAPNENTNGYFFLETSIYANTRIQENVADKQTQSNFDEKNTQHILFL